MRRTILVCLLAVGASAGDDEKLLRVAIEAKLKVGDLLREKGDLEGAMKAYREAVQLWDSHRNAVFVEGVKREQPGKPFTDGKPWIRNKEDQTDLRLIRVRLQTPEGKALTRALAKRLQSPRGRGREVYAIATEMPVEKLPPIERWDYTQCGLGLWIWRDGPRDLAGTLTLPKGRACFISLLFRNVVLARQKLPLDTDEVVFKIRPEDVLEKLSGIAVKLADRNGNPVTDAVVHFGVGGLMAPRKTPDSNGAIRFNLVRPGVNELLVWPAGHEALRRLVLIEPGRVLDLGVLRLRERKVIRGRVTDAGGQPLRAYVTLRRTDVAMHLQPRPVAYRTRTHEDGSFAYEYAADREYVVAVEARGMAAQALRARGGAAPVTVQMVPGTEVQFRATWRDLQTFCIVSVRDVRGLVVARRLDRLETTSVWLAPGSYTIETFDPTFARREQKITVAKAPLQIRIEG